MVEVDARVWERPSYCSVQLNSLTECQLQSANYPVDRKHCCYSGFHMLMRSQESALATVKLPLAAVHRLTSIFPHASYLQLVRSLLVSDCTYTLLTNVFDAERRSAAESQRAGSTERTREVGCIREAQGLQADYFPTNPQSLSILQDYSLRAKDYNDKKKRLKVLRQKAAERNPNEFHFAMMRSKTHDKGQKLADRGNPVLSQDAVKLLKTQDAGYLRIMVQKTMRARERLEHEFVLRDGKGAEVLGDKNSPGDQQHIVFAESREEQRKSHPALCFGTTPDGLGRRFDRPSVGRDDPGESEGKEQVMRILSKGKLDDWKVRRLAERKALALKEARALRKRRKREQEAQRSHLKALKMREKDLLAAEQELELQRAKMSNSVGGVNKAGVAWKVRGRKK